jgi:hypothetical protein
MGYLNNGRPYFDLLHQRMTKYGIDLHLISDMVYWDPLDKNDWSLLKTHFRAITAYNMYYRDDFITSVRSRFQLADRLAKENGLRLIPNAMPGYDDTHLRGLDRQVLQRKDGQFYRLYWNMASDFVDRKQPFLFITSFNEWHEGSEVEPSIENGDRYLSLTHDQIDALRRRIKQENP